MSKAKRKEKLEFFRDSLFHPFYAFYEIRFRDKGSPQIAAVILLLFGILQCASFQYTGFIMNNNYTYEMNSLAIFGTTIAVVVLAAVSNWSVTTLFDGKGGIKDIFIVLCYSLTPSLVLSSVVVFASNFVIEEEVMILLVLQIIGYIWSALLILAGLSTIHEYTFGGNLSSLIVTVVVAALIVFMGVLFFTMIESLYNFVVSIIQELSRRL